MRIPARPQGVTAAAPVRYNVWAMAHRYPTLQARRKRRAKTKRGLSRAILVALAFAPFFLALLAVGTVTVGLQMASAVSEDIPQLEDQRRVELPQTTRIYAADGTLLAYLHGVENREIIGGERIPAVAKNAIVAIEDERFYEHQGVDAEAAVRAFVANVQAEGINEGFSTLTMQLVGTLYLDRTDQSLERKLDEMALALQMEELMSKDEILDLYLNTVYFGSNAYGIQAASRTYFNKYPADLTLEEAALLAGMPQAPSRYNTRINPDAAKDRRNTVLQRMWFNEYITIEEYQRAVAAPLELAPSSIYEEVREPYVVDYVKKQLIEMFGVDRVFEGGLSVGTSINPAYQRHGEWAIKDTLNQPGDPSAALVAVDPESGLIRAMVGSSDYDSSKFNLAAQAKRQAGSAFKTFGLTAAVEMGMNPATTIYNSQPVQIDIPGSKPWKVQTFSHSYYGASTLVQATLRSDNSVYAQLAMDVTPQRIVDVAKRMGITSPLSPNPAIILGGLTYGVSPLEMASAYGTLANQGVHVEPRMILEVKDSNNRVIYESERNANQAVSEGVAYAVTEILIKNIQAGTGTNAQIGRPAAGKTGTAQNFRDAWFSGYTPQISTSVWMGHPEAQVEMRNVHGRRVTGGSFPAIIWGKFMGRIMKDYPVTDFAKPDSPVKYKDVKTTYARKKSTVDQRPTRRTSSTLAPETTLAPPVTQPPSTLAPPITQPPATQPPATLAPPITEAPASP